MAFTVVVGSRVIPWLLDHVAAHPLARAVHADRAGAGARHRRRLGHCLRRLDGARRVPRRHGRRPVRVQPARGVGRAADARRVRRAVLRLGRDAARPAVPARGARPDPGDAGRRPRRQAAGRAPDRPAACAIRSASRCRSRSRWRRSASSRSSWPTSAGTSASCRATRRTRWSRSRLCRSCSTRCCIGWSRRSNGGRPRVRASGSC